MEELRCFSNTYNLHCFKMPFNLYDFSIYFAVSTKDNNSIYKKRNYSVCSGPNWKLLICSKGVNLWF